MLSFKVTNRSKSRYQLVWGAQTEGCDPDPKFEARLRLDHAWSVEGADLQPDRWPAPEVKVQAMRVNFLTQPWKNTRRSFVTQIWNQWSIWSPFDMALTVWPLAHSEVKFSCSLCAVSSVCLCACFKTYGNICSLDKTQWRKYAFAVSAIFAVTIKGFK